MKKAAAYLRGNKKYQLDGQMEIIEKYARENDYEIVAEYRDVGSGQRTSFPNQTRMIEDAKYNKFRYVLISDQYRFSSIMDAVHMTIRKLDESGVMVMNAENNTYLSLGIFESPLVLEFKKILELSNQP